MKLKINKKLLPLKFHFFIFWASYSSALPFIMVVARQLGIPVGVQGTVSAAIITAAVLAKPVISAAADFLPNFRKAIFLALLTIMVTTVGPIGFLPPMYQSPSFTGVLLSGSSSESSDEFYFLTNSSDTDSCVVSAGWDCTAFCYMFENCPLGNSSLNFLKMVHQRAVIENNSDSSAIEHLKSSISKNTNSHDNLHYLYKLEGIFPSFITNNSDARVICTGGERSGVDCVPPWHTMGFWVYVILLLAGQVSATTAESISDAICLDTIGEDGDYGSQRAWGALSYGIFGTVSGVLVDWHSGSNFIKDYTPAFLLLVIFGTLDVLLSAVYLKVPKFESGSTMWVNLRPLLFQPKFFAFLVFAFLVGFYDGVDTGYVFILQEDIAAGTSTMKHMKLLQGLTMLVQALSAAPFMFVYGWFMKTLGSQKVISLVLGLYALRLVGLALAGYAKFIWATIAIEVINGPCFGLGYTAIIVHASSITPQGTSATVQSVVNICYGTLGYAGASLIGGILYESVGGIWLYSITGILASITCIIHLMSLKFLSPKHETPRCPEDDVTKHLSLKSLKDKDESEKGSMENEERMFDKNEEEAEEEKEKTTLLCQSNPEESGPQLRLGSPETRHIKEEG